MNALLMTAALAVGTCCSSHEIVTTRVHVRAPNYYVRAPIVYQGPVYAQTVTVAPVIRYHRPIARRYVPVFQAPGYEESVQQAPVYQLPVYRTPVRNFLRAPLRSCIGGKCR